MFVYSIRIRIRSFVGNFLSVLSFPDRSLSPQLQRHWWYFRGMLEQHRGQSWCQCIRRIGRQYPFRWLYNFFFFSSWVWAVFCLECFINATKRHFLAGLCSWSPKIADLRLSNDESWNTQQIAFFWHQQTHSRGFKGAVKVDWRKKNLHRSEKQNDDSCSWWADTHWTRCTPLKCVSSSAWLRQWSLGFFLRDPPDWTKSKSLGASVFYKVSNEAVLRSPPGLRSSCYGNVKGRKHRVGFYSLREVLMRHMFGCKQNKKRERVSVRERENSFVQMLLHVVV